MVEIDLSKLSELNNSMDELQYWFTVVVYVLIGLVGFLVLYTIFKILSCGVCLLKCVTCPCRCLCKKKKKKDTSKDNLLEYDGMKV